MSRQERNRETLRHTVLVALGANNHLNDALLRDTLTSACDRLASAQMTPVSRSDWIDSAAHPPGSGPDYANGVARFTSALAPAAILALLHAVEAEFGRVRGRRWAARTLDLDLLAVGPLVLPDAATQRRWSALDPAAQAALTPEVLILPHPRLHQRRFVLAPLLQVAPEWRHPVSGLTAAGMLRALDAANATGG